MLSNFSAISKIDVVLEHLSSNAPFAEKNREKRSIKFYRGAYANPLEHLRVYNIMDIKYQYIEKAGCSTIYLYHVKVAQI